LTLEETRNVLQELAGKVFKNSTVECRLLSFKFTVIGEVKALEHISTIIIIYCS